ncbi:hypothetical protein FV141_05660 [Dermacoccus abyssi]|uniref:Phospholipase D-like domain-containing protein n=1 Tax=Dermacoccus abyssi TaxID=322596 RepID=A0ABX5ZBE4_9MICO|nr:hypothetical protein FV141_05660 [Dermacoccus abyssi]
MQPMYRLDDVSGYLGSDESDDSGDSAVVGTEQMPLGRLHAKMYISEHWSRLTEDRVIIGSANATGPAFSRNVEFLVEMRGHRKKFGIERFLDDLGELAIPYETGGGAEPDREEDVQRRLDDAVRAVAEARFRVKVQAIGAGPEEGYDLLIVTDEPVGIAAGYTATVSVLGFDSRTMPLTNGERFDGRCRGVSLTQITPLLVVTATDGERTSTSVVIAELDNAPDGRLDAIVAEQLDTPDKFLKFALLMLNFGDRALAGEVLRGGREDSGSRQSSGLLPGSLLDTVLQALATNPEALAELDAVVQAMGKRRKNDANPANEQSTFDWDAFNGFWAEVSAAQKDSGGEVTRYVADDHVGGLTDFQRASVDHVINRFYKDGARRFLVADETGLGKTRVARGVIARSIEHLQDDDTVGRIDVVYICANADLAQQNLVKLNVTGSPERRFANRLTLLPLYANGLDEPTEGGRKRINLVSFTPGTSFDLGNTEGTAIERAVLYQAMCEIYALDGWGRRTALRIFQGGVRSLERFRRVYVDNWAAPALADGIHEPILDKFDEKLAAVDEDGWSLDDEWSSLLDDIGRRTELSPELDERRWRFVGAPASGHGPGERRNS